jgi:hypothetical protein
MEESMKAIYGMILVVLLGSCSPFGLNPMGYAVLHEDLDVAWKKVSSMKYINDNANYTKSPIEFFKDGGGDCEDFAVALMYLLGEDSTFVSLEGHAILKWHNKYLEPQIYGKMYDKDNLDIEYTVTYDQMMFVVTNWGMSRSL